MEGMRKKGKWGKGKDTAYVTHGRIETPLLEIIAHCWRSPKTRKLSDLTWDMLPG